MPSARQRKLADLAAVLSFLPKWLNPISEERFRQWFPWYQTVHWFMDYKTRTVIIDASRELGEAFMRLENQRGSEDFSAKEEAREAYEAAKDEFVNRVVEAMFSDPFHKDLFHRPCVFTRIQAYLKLDGIQPTDRGKLVKQIRNRTDMLYLLG